MKWRGGWENWGALRNQCSWVKIWICTVNTNHNMKYRAIIICKDQGGYWTSWSNNYCRWILCYMPEIFQMSHFLSNALTVSNFSNVFWAPVALKFSERNSISIYYFLIKKTKLFEFVYGLWSDVTALTDPVTRPWPLGLTFSDPQMWHLNLPSFLMLAFTSTTTTTFELVHPLPMNEYRYTMHFNSR